MYDDDFFSGTSVDFSSTHSLGTLADFENTIFFLSTTWRKIIYYEIELLAPYTMSKCIHLELISMISAFSNKNSLQNYSHD